MVKNNKQNNSIKQIFGMLDIYYRPTGVKNLIGWDVKETDFGFTETQDLIKAVDELKPLGVQPLQTGQLVKIFNSITKGEVYWHGIVQHDHERLFPAQAQDQSAEQIPLAMDAYPSQEGLGFKKWAAMFSGGMPARLEKTDGSIVYGSLEAFCETGTEGVIWSVSEFGKQGYHGLNCLEAGDKLTVYSKVLDGNVIYEGETDISDSVSKVADCWDVARTVKHYDDAKWLAMSFSNCPAIITPR